MSKKTNINWQEVPFSAFIQIGNRFEFDNNSVGGSIFMHHVLSQKEGHISEGRVEGGIKSPKDDKNGSRYIQYLENLGGRLVYKKINTSIEHFNSVFIYDHGVVQLEHAPYYVNVKSLSLDESFVKELNAHFSKDFVLSPPRRGHIYTILRQNEDLDIVSIGDASIPLIHGNYTPTVMEDFNYIITDLRSSHPSGRISIIEGEPGTGKTHLIRGLLDKLPDTMFVLISPDVVPSLAGPELLPLLLATKSNQSKIGPIVLVLEDADRCLVAREKGDMSQIQSLLNLGDGILGSLLDLRIIATTNASKLDMEAAILRPGRLSKRLEVGPLDHNTAEGVFRCLCPNSNLPKELYLPYDFDKTKSFKMTLAEVYSLARKHGWKPELRDITEDNDSDDSEQDYID